MILRRRMLEKYDEYRFNIPYKAGDRVLVKNGERVRVGTKLIKRGGSNIGYSFFLPEYIDTQISKLPEYVNCMDGEFVKKDDVLVEKVLPGGLSVKKVKAPASGVVDLSRLDKGFLDILGEERDVTVKSSFNGVVEEINPVEGINIISSAYALDLLSISDFSLRDNKEKNVVGEFLVLGEGNDLKLKVDSIDCEGKIVFVGKYLHEGLLHDLFEKGTLFVLTYSMEYMQFRKQGLPVGIIGGFGPIYSSKKMMDLLANMNEKMAVVSYDESQIFFITNEKEYENKEELVVKTTIGSTVISRSLSNYGMLGTVVSLEEDSPYMVVQWEGGQSSIINIGSVEFVSI